MDNRRVYRTIRMAMKQLIPTETQSNFARMLTSLAAMVSGIVRARSCQLLTIIEYIKYLIWPKRKVGSSAIIAGFKMVELLVDCGSAPQKI
jgi:hypothetical protein